MSTDLARLIADTTRARDESLASLASHLRLAQMEAHLARVRSEQLGESGGAAARSGERCTGRPAF